MILFENGVCHGGETAGIIEPYFDEHSGDDLYLNPITDTCWLLTISDGGNQIRLLTADEVDFDFVPTEGEVGCDSYEFFYATNLTALFESYDEALDFMDHYHGVFKDQVEAFYQSKINPLRYAGHIES